MKEIRLLTADEIECRVHSSTDKGCSLLLYKDARVDMKILDETFGIFGWQRTHEVINDNLFCSIEIYDHERNFWVKKQDVGIESNTEKEKGQASDSFKRAGFNVGIGRELYTAPFIWIAITRSDLNDKGKVKTKFFISDIKYTENREIFAFIINDDKGKERYVYSAGKSSFVKSESSKPKTETYDEAFDKRLKDILLSVEKANTYNDVIKIWNDNEDLKKVQSFVNAIKAKGTEFKNALECK